MNSILTESGTVSYRWFLFTRHTRNFPGCSPQKGKRDFPPSFQLDFIEK